MWTMKKGGRQDAGAESQASASVLPSTRDKSTAGEVAARGEKASNRGGAELAEDPKAEGGQESVIVEKKGDHAALCKWTIAQFGKVKARALWSKYFDVGGYDCRLLVYPKGTLRHSQDTSPSISRCALVSWLAFTPMVAPLNRVMAAPVVKAPVKARLLGFLLGGRDWTPVLSSPSTHWRVAGHMSWQVCAAREPARLVGQQARCWALLQWGTSCHDGLQRVGSCPAGIVSCICCSCFSLCNDRSTGVVSRRAVVVSCPSLRLTGH